MEWIYTWTCGLIRIISDYVYYTCVMHVNHIYIREYVPGVKDWTFVDNLKKNLEQSEVTSCVQCFTGFLQKIWRIFRSRMKWLHAYNVSRASYRESEEKFGVEWRAFPASDVSHASYGHWDEWSRKLSIPCQIPTSCYLFQRSSIVISSQTDATRCYLLEEFNPDSSQKQIEP